MSSAGAGGTCPRPMRLPDPSPAPDKNRAPMGPEILSSTGAGVWRKAPESFGISRLQSVLDKLQSAIFLCLCAISSLICYSQLDFSSRNQFRCSDTHSHYKQRNFNCKQISFNCQASKKAQLIPLKFISVRALSR